MTRCAHQLDDAGRVLAVYPSLLRLLDDSSDDVRLAACDTFTAYVHCMAPRDASAAHVAAIYDGLLVHLDDHDPAIQQAVLGHALSLTLRLLDADL